jgi:hypothetical protein
VFWVIVLCRDARIGCAFGGREGIVYTVGDSRKFVDVGLANVEGLESAAVFGCRWDDLPGDSGGGSRPRSTSGGFEDKAAPKVACVGVRAGLRSGIEGVEVLEIVSSAFVCSVPMISWYQS